MRMVSLGSFAFVLAMGGGAHTWPVCKQIGYKIVTASSGAFWVHVSPASAGAVMLARKQSFVAKIRLRNNINMIVQVLVGVF